MPFAAGGYSDVLLRVIGEVFLEKLKQPIVVENRTGANGFLAYQAAADSPGDGYTLTMLSNSTAGSLAIQRRPNDIDKKFRFLGSLWDLPNVVVVRSDSKIKSMADLIAHAKAQPGFAYTSVGMGSAGHIGLAAFASKNDLSMEHIGYRGGLPAMTDVVAGVVPVMYSDMGSAAALLQSGALRALLVSSKDRHKTLPDVPTATELGYPEMAIVSMAALAAPAGLSDDRAKVLSEATLAAINAPLVIERAEAGYGTMVFRNGEETRRLINEAYAFVLNVAEKNNIRSD
jgi:tripartite-type tricarboxylate transporter receptor subunit TctC